MRNWWWWLGRKFNIPNSTLTDIKQRHSDDRGRLEAVIIQWLSVDPATTWRRVITTLDVIGAHQTADSICQYAEPLTGMS